MIGLIPALATALPVPDPGDGGLDLDWQEAPSPAGTQGWGIGGSTAGIVVSTINDGSFVSHDNAMTWSPTPAGIDEGDIVFDPSDPEVGYYGGFGGLARTTDGGDTWDLVIDTSRARAVTVSSTGTVLSSVRTDGFITDIWISHDQGETWEDIGWPSDTSLVYGLAFGPTEDHIVVMAISDTWATTDGGQTWTHDPDNGGRWLASAPNGNIWRAGFGPLEVSTDGGLTWTEVDSPGVGPMTFNEDGRLYIASNSGVLFTDDEGDSWTNMGGADISWAATGIIVDPGNPDAVLMSDEGVGVTWVGPTGDGGYTLEGRTTGFPPVQVDALGTSLDGQVHLAGSPTGVYQSRDAGDTWTHTGAGIGLSKLHTVATSDGQTLYAGGQNLILQAIILASPDGGDTWTFALPEGNDGKVLDIAVDPEDPTHAWAAVYIDLAPSSVYETTDGGQTWQAVFTLEEKVRDVAYDASTGTPLVATEAGVYGEDETTGTWTQRSLTPDSSQAIAAGNGNVYAEGPQVPLWKGVVETTTLVPWADTDGSFVELHVDPADGEEVWIVNNFRDLVNCQPPVPGLPPGCQTVTSESGDPSVVSAFVTPGGEQVVVATPSDGLYAAQVAG